MTSIFKTSTRKGLGVISNKKHVGHVDGLDNTTIYSESQRRTNKAQILYYKIPGDKFENYQEGKVIPGIPE